MIIFKEKILIYQKLLSMLKIVHLKFAHEIVEMMQLNQHSNHPIALK
jgi:hypothetical protein